MMTFNQIHLWVSVALLAALLFFPVSRIILQLSCRRLVRKRGVELTEQELAGQRNRARFITLPLVTVFAYLFCINIIRGLYGG